MAGRGDEALLRADVPAIHVFLAVTKPGRGSPGQALWWRRCSGRLLSVMAGRSDEAIHLRSCDAKPRIASLALGKWRLTIAPHRPPLRCGRPPHKTGRN